MKTMQSTKNEKAMLLNIEGKGKVS